MALTLQRKLELAGDLAKVQPTLRRLHLLRKPPKRHRLRNAILVTSAIGAGAVVLVVALRRRGRDNDATAVDEDLLVGGLGDGSSAGLRSRRGEPTGLREHGIGVTEWVAAAPAPPRRRRGAGRRVAGPAYPRARS